MTTVPQFQLHVEGEWRNALTGETFSRLNPANGELVATYQRAGKDDVDCAVQAARRAFDLGGWPDRSGNERGQVLRRCAQLLEQQREALARQESLESGMRLEVARMEVGWSIEVFEHFAVVARGLAGRFYPLSPQSAGLVLHEPRGVAGLITPWNFPLSQLTWKVVPALAAGCTVVAKPSSLAPGTTLMLAEILAEAGVSAGVYNVITGPGASAGQALVEHPGVDLISLTGDNETGQQVMRAAAGQTKRLALELGGKSANIVFADADLDKAADFAAGAIFNRCGQVCTAGSRLLVQRSIHDELLARVVAAAHSYRVGDPLDPETQMEPLVSEAQLQTVLTFVQQGIQEGARLVAGGQRLTGAGYERGWYVAPTVFDQVLPGMAIAREEIFGPVLSVLTFDDEADAVRQANATRYGLAGAVWTADLARALRVARAVHAGTFWINQYGTIEMELPFGGFKQSGFGRELGSEAMWEYTEPKSIHVRM